MNFRFYIFGSPDDFDLLPDCTEEEKNYFQTFYDGSKENTKFTMHRRANGQVSYSYFKYNLISVNNRPGAFFGMSVVFDREVCTDVTGLYELFEAVYRTILQNRILLEEIEGNPNVQAIFLVPTFKEAKNEVKRIEHVISKNLLNAFANDIRPIDSSYTPEYKEAESILKVIPPKEAPDFSIETQSIERETTEPYFNLFDTVEVEPIKYPEDEPEGGNNNIGGVLKQNRNLTTRFILYIIVIVIVAIITEILLLITRI